MPGQMDDSYQTFCVSALIHGKSFMDVNNGTLGAGAQAFVQDGVQYQLLECDDLEIFANMGGLSRSSRKLWTGISGIYIG